MSKRYYTVAEVDALLPAVSALFVQITQLRTHLRPLYKRLEQAGVAPKRSDFEVAAPGLSPDQLRDRGAFKGMLEALNEAIAEVDELGGQVKDLDEGLVDWLARSGEREVWLCWRFGENVIGHWHEFDAGAQSRKPVSDLAAPARGASHKSP